MLKSIAEKPFVQSIIAFLGYLIIMFVCKSNRFKAVGVEHVKEMQKTTGGLILLWHQSLLLPIFSCRGLGLAPIIASSRDGELICRLVKKLGYDAVRGSTGKADGISALMTSLRLVRQKKVIPITPDGPVGPLYNIHKGAIAILKKTGCPFTACGTAMKNPIILEKAWDKHRIPRPFDKSAVVFAEPVTISPDISDEEAAEIITNAINEANRKAEELIK